MDRRRPRRQSLCHASEVTREAIREARTRLLGVLRRAHAVAHRPADHVGAAVAGERGADRAAEFVSEPATNRLRSRSSAIIFNSRCIGATWSASMRACCERQEPSRRTTTVSKLRSRRCLPTARRSSSRTIWRSCAAAWRRTSGLRLAQTLHRSAAAARAHLRTASAYARHAPACASCIAKALEEASAWCAGNADKVPGALSEQSRRRHRDLPHHRGGEGGLQPGDDPAIRHQRRRDCRGCSGGRLAGAAGRRECGWRTANDPGPDAGAAV